MPNMLAHLFTYPGNMEDYSLSVFGLHQLLSETSDTSAAPLCSPASMRSIVNLKILVIAPLKKLSPLNILHYSEHKPI